ncbi:MerR family transcriptional regulator [Paenibacillus sp. R14(2021)]|uniref:MerR family transcriptional regulator n=1 Tax=Paenibacillus sp. R14(2021) TaxID=2859228 RepID=UPI001C612D60|nr:MerR family transcriptional regulator [Paenibacillus sp. R14(2021)]
MTQRWKVGELARIAGLTVRTLRYYDGIGLFSPSGHSESGHRLYTEADLTRLQQILSLKELGLSLDEMKSVLTGGQYSLSDIVSLQITRIQQQVIVQQKLLRQLEHVARLMANNQPLTVDDFTKLLGTMRMSHEKFFAEKQASWQAHLDRLGDFLDKQRDP